MQINKIYYGDCLKIMPEIDDKSIDMILCDLPYGLTQCSWDSIIPFEPLWEQYKRIIKDNRAIVLTASQPFTSKLVMSNLKMFKYCWVWEKTKPTGHLTAKKRPLKIHEDILVFYKNMPIYNPQGTVLGEFKNSRKNRRKDSIYNNVQSNIQKEFGVSKIGNYPKSIQKFSNPSNSGSLHPTQKPLALFEYLIKTYTNKGNLVLDNCSGSGTTGIACINTNRNYILIEKEKKYYEIAKRRINANK